MEYIGLEMSHDLNVVTIFQFPDVVEFSEKMAEMGRTVIVAALDSTYQREVCISFVSLIIHLILYLYESRCKKEKFTHRKSFFFSRELRT